MIIPVVCYHYTPVQYTSLLFPQKFGQKSTRYTQQNTVMQEKVDKGLMFASIDETTWEPTPLCLATEWDVC